MVRGWWASKAQSTTWKVHAAVAPKLSTNTYSPALLPLKNTLIFSCTKDIHQLCRTLFLSEQIKRQKLQLQLCQRATLSHAESFQRCHPMFLADKNHSPASNHFQSPKILLVRAFRLEPRASRQRFLHEVSSPTLLMLTIRIS